MRGRSRVGAVLIAIVLAGAGTGIAFAHNGSHKAASAGHHQSRHGRSGHSAVVTSPPASDTPDVTETPEPAETPEAPEATEAPKTPEPAETPDVTDAAKTPEPSDTPEVGSGDDNGADATPEPTDSAGTTTTDSGSHGGNDGSDG
jgi:hypothetical protein